VYDRSCGHLSVEWALERHRRPPTLGERRAALAASLSLSLFGKSSSPLSFFFPSSGGFYPPLPSLLSLLSKNLSARAKTLSLSSIRKILKPKIQIDDSSTRKNYYFVQRRRHFYLDYFGKIKEEAKEKWLTTRQRGSSQQQTKSDSIEKESQCVSCAD
jgi:hypothetical protein